MSTSQPQTHAVIRQQVASPAMTDQALSSEQSRTIIALANGNNANAVRRSHGMPGVLYRHRDSAECDADMADADVVPADGGKKPKKDKKEKKEKKDKKEKKKHKKEKKDRMQEHDKDVGSSDEDAQAGRSADDRRRFEEDLRQKALQSTRKTESSDD